MPELLLAFVILLALVLLDVAAHRYGADTRFTVDRSRLPPDAWW
jgi:hypothetical protein